MKDFNYHSAKDSKEASKLASSSSAFLAGGMTTIPSMKLGLATYKDLIDIKNIRIPLMKDIRTSHDMLLWLDILKNEEYAFGLNQVLASYRLSSNSNTKNKLFAAIDVWRVYRNYERLNFIDSFYNFMHYAFNALKKRI